MAAEIHSRYPDARVELLEGSGGIFDVSRDGVLIFSKRKAGRHARPGEIVELLRSPAATS